MAQIFRMPAMGQTMQEATILKWLKQEGESVKKGEPLLEIMTDKVSMEIESDYSGTLLKILQEPEAVVPVQGPLAIIGESGEDISSLLAEVSGRPPAEAAVPLRSTPVREPSPPPLLAPQPESPTLGEPSFPTAMPFKVSPRARKRAEEAGIDLRLLAGRGSGPGGRIIESDVLALIEEQRVRATPLAERIAAERGVELRELVGTGPGGKVLKEDVLRAITPPAPPAEPQRIPIVGMRKAIAEAVVRSFYTAPHVTMTMEVDMTEAMALYRRLAEEVQRRYQQSLSLTALIARATVLALKDHPRLNATVEQETLLLWPDVHLGIAVALPEGLVAPVIHNADRKSLLELSQEIKKLADRAREGRLTPQEISGGTFTITNLGGYGIEEFTPIINPPQVAILGVGQIARKPVVVEDRIEPRDRMKLSLSFDHRVIDGAPAAEFMRDIKEYLEAPWRMLV